MIHVFFNGEEILPFQPITFPKITVDRSKDTDPKNPIPTVYPMTIDNDTNHVLNNIILETNIPSDCYDLYDMPKEVTPKETVTFNFYFYGRKALDSPNFPAEVYMQLKGSELLVRN